MTDVKLGSIITSETERDAIHVAVAPVVAATNLKPGTHVGLNENGEVEVSEKPIGIVDPFLLRCVFKGERFWLMLYQNTVTGMKHHWSHPAFSEKTENSKNIHEKWIRGYADKLGVHYNELMQGAESHTSYGDYLSRPHLEGEITSEEFWTHYEALTGKSGSGNFFTCSC